MKVSLPHYVTLVSGVPSVFFHYKYLSCDFARLQSFGWHQLRLSCAGLWPHLQDPSSAQFSLGLCFLVCAHHWVSWVTTFVHHSPSPALPCLGTAAARASLHGLPEKDTPVALSCISERARSFPPLRVSRNHQAAEAVGAGCVGSSPGGRRASLWAGPPPSWDVLSYGRCQWAIVLKVALSPYPLPAPLPSCHLSSPEIGTHHGLEMWRFPLWVLNITRDHSPPDDQGSVF